LVARQLKSFGAPAIEHSVQCAELWQLSLAIGRGCECSPEVVVVWQLNGCGRSQSNSCGEILAIFAVCKFKNGTRSQAGDVLPALPAANANRVDDFAAQTRWIKNRSADQCDLRP